MKCIYLKSTSFQPEMAGGHEKVKGGGPFQEKVLYSAAD